MLSNLCLATVLVVAVTATLVTTRGSAQTGLERTDEAIARTTERLAIKLPEHVTANLAVRAALDELTREACDQKAIANLSTALDKAGFRRQAATANISFSDQCGGYPWSLRKAANLLLELGDNTQAVSVASDLIKLEPFGDNGYFLRALASEKAGNYKKAVEDYITALELFGNKERVSSVGYMNLARSYDRLGLHCDAVLPIEAWVALNPSRNDNSQIRTIIADYTARCKCSAAKAGGVETFPIGRSNQLIRVVVQINGVQGNFIVDTGATFVSVKAGFARKANVDIEHDSIIKLHTANGMTDAKRGRARTIQLRSLSASDVPIVVQTDTAGTYGDGIDGLLGMSFLSRFNVAMEANTLKITKRER